MKKHQKLLLILCVPFLLMLGCNHPDSGSFSPQPNQYNITNNSDMADVPDMGAWININTVDGERKNGNDVIEFAGAPISFVYDYINNSNIGLNIICIALVDGYIQPFTVDGSDEEVMTYTRWLEAGEAVNILIKYCPVVVPENDKTILTALVVLSNVDKICEPDATTLDFFDYISIHHGLLMRTSERYNGPTGKSESVAWSASINDFDNEIGYDDNLGNMIWARFTESGDITNLSRYLRVPAEKENFSLSLSAPSGKYRTMMMVNGRPIAAFNNHYYLDWESVGLFDEKSGMLTKYHTIKIDKEVLPDSKQSVFALTFPIDMEAYDPQEFHPAMSMPVAIDIV